MSQVTYRRPVVLAISALFLCSISLVAQSDSGSIVGFVKDQSGAVIPNALITLKNEATNIERQTTANEAGYYVFTSVPPGLHSVAAEAKGFKKVEVKHNKLDPNSSLAVDVSLQIGAATETIEVTASSQVLQTESGTVQKLVTREQIDSLELNGRNPIGLASLVPGARGGNLAGLNFNFSQGPANFNGSRNPENLITYDGAPATRTRSNGTSLGAADVDSTSEVQILTAGYAAEYGRTSGAQIRIVTKSGGKDFHGAGYEYVRNTVFNSNTWTRNNTAGPAYLGLNSPAPIRYNQYGYNIGGPGYIPGKFNTSKNKFFWYWGQEWVNYRFTDSASWTVPTNAMRQGDFSELLNPNNFFYGRVVQLKDPTTGAPIPGNMIPKTQLSANGWES